MDLIRTGVLVEAKPVGPPAALTLAATRPEERLLLERLECVLRTGPVAVRLTELLDWYEREMESTPTEGT